jgi:hypothetical protein
MSFTYNPPTNLNFSASSSLSGTLSWTASTPIVNPTGLLLHMDGANGSTFFPDSSGNNLNGTGLPGSIGGGSGTVTVTTSDFEFATGSADFLGTGTIAVPFASGSPLDVSSGDFTIEFWIKAPAQTEHSLARFVRSDGTHFNGPAMLIENAGTGLLQILIAGDGFWAGSVNPVSGTFATNTWTHFAMVFLSSGGFANLYVNGVLTTSQVGAISQSSMAANIGGNYLLGYAPGADGGSGFVGLIDEFRLEHSAVYTSNFTPPIAPFADGNPPPGYDVLRNGVSIAHVTGVTSFFDTVPTQGTYQYTVAAWDGASTDISDVSAPLDVTFTVVVPNVHVYGKFIGSLVFPPTLLIDAKGIKPRVYAPKENVTVKT